MVEIFQHLSGLNYDKHRLKNKWDQLKSIWQLRKELKGKEIILWWDARLEEVDALALSLVAHEITEATF